MQLQKNTMTPLDQLCINTLRFLAVDAVEQAKSGHPGMPLGVAPMTYAVWKRFLRHNPKNPAWFNRDRFILSAGHGSALLYAMLHVTGYDLSLNDIKHFRQWGSKTPGHPEYGHAPGVEATTGPLGQGFAMGVGMAIAERFLAANFNRPGFPVVDHYTYAIVSDGDLMEAVSSEAASLAGTLGLGKLIYLYDDNDISIEGNTECAFTEDVGSRFTAYGWQVLSIADGNDIESIAFAISAAKVEQTKPSLIVVKTHIGYGSPKQDTAAAHGEPLGPEAAKETKKALGWPLEPHFYIPDEALNNFRQAVEQGKKWEADWNTLFENYKKAYPDLAVQFEKAVKGELPKDWDSALPHFKPEDGAIATRSASGKIMNAIAKISPHFIGGSADLSPSTMTYLNNCGDFSSQNPQGRNLHFGVREHAMAAIVNGMALHHGVISYGSTFLIFSDYMRPAIRLAALMQTHSIFIFTHDSIGLGEDGPTHQPVEQLMSLRLIPGFILLRPADANETMAAWKIVLERRRPAALALTRQKLPILDSKKYMIDEGVPKGGYILTDAGQPDIILIATGSEVHLVLSAREELLKQGVKARVVSMPSCEIFNEQPEEYRNSVLSPDIPKLAVEAGSPLGWKEYVGDTGDVIGLNRFGASAPGNTVLEQLGFSVENVVKRVHELLQK
ncbi:MAG: transketolase [Candidatus Omnitrophica bacterium]|nr:transketolase [Candidatus Omnitrophota bacterium]